MTGSDPKGTASKPSLFQSLKEAARRLKVETYALYLACLDPSTPWYAKAWAVLVVAYAFSPIDLIPDFVPVLGYLDDLVIIPLGIWLALRMIPPQVMANARLEAAKGMGPDSRLGRWGAVVIVLIWLVALAVVGVVVYRLVESK
jgi:uncharacterized membrane protein YkvA (DUF1232 family)